MTCPLDETRLRDCLSAVELYQAWYERSILGCKADRWLELSPVEDFEEWLDENAAHRDSALGVFARYGRSIGLQTTGAATPNLLSMGCYDDPKRGSRRSTNAGVCSRPGSTTAIPSGSSRSTRRRSARTSATPGIRIPGDPPIPGTAELCPPAAPTGHNTATPRPPATTIGSSSWTACRPSHRPRSAYHRAVPRAGTEHLATENRPLPPPGTGPHVHAPDAA